MKTLKTFVRTILLKSFLLTFSLLSILFLAYFWNIYFKDMSWRTDRFPSWLIISISIGVFLPWEIFVSVRNTSAFEVILGNIRVTGDRLMGRIKNLFSSVFNRSFVTRLIVTIILLLLFSIYAERFIIIEYNTWLSLRYSLSSLISRSEDYFQGVDIPWIGATKRDFLQWSSLTGILFFSMGLIILRQTIRFIFHSSIESAERALVNKIENFLSNRNKTKLFAYVIFAVIMLACLSFILNQSKYSFTVTPPKDRTAAPNTAYVSFPPKEEIFVETFTIQNFDITTSKVTGAFRVHENKHLYTEGGCFEEWFEIICSETVGFPPVFYDKNSIIINGETIPVSIGAEKAIVHKKDLVIDALGSNYLFPFNKYTVAISISPAIPRNEAQVTVSTNQRFFVVSPAESKTDGKNSSLTFYIGYAPYYKILVLVIFFALFAFLWVIWDTNERETLIELSVGVFATIITMRGFLIPQEFSTDPILLDEVLLLYIALFLFVLLYKHGEISSRKN